jgi:hypothetical protein
MAAMTLDIGWAAPLLAVIIIGSLIAIATLIRKL